MKLTKSTTYTVELTTEEFDIIADALYTVEHIPSSDFDLTDKYTPDELRILRELSRRFYEKE